MCEYRFNFLAGHALQQTSGDSNQRRVTKCPCGKGVGLTFINSDLGHFQACALRQVFHCVKQPGFVCVLRLINDLRTRGHLGHPLAHQQRNKSTSKAHHHGKAQQSAEIESVGSQELVNAQQAGHNTQDQHDGQVGDDEKNDAFHEVL